MASSSTQAPTRATPRMLRSTCNENARLVGRQIVIVGAADADGDDRLRQVVEDRHDRIGAAGDQHGLRPTLPVPGTPCARRATPPNARR